MFPITSIIINILAIIPSVYIMCCVALYVLSQFTLKTALSQVATLHALQKRKLRLR